MSRPRSIARLARPWATTAPAASSAAHASGLVEDVALGDAVDEPDAQRLLGADLAAGEDQVLGPGRADEAGEALGAAAAGDDAEQDLGLAEAGRRPTQTRRSHASASSQPPPRAKPVTAAIVGPRDGGHGVERPRKRVADDAGLVGPAELGDVGAGREHARRTR